MLRATAACEHFIAATFRNAPITPLFKLSRPSSARALPFADRSAAGVRLGELVTKLGLAPPVLVLALPRGGVPVALGVAAALHAPLDVLPVRKIGMPGQPELAVGAIAVGGTIVREPQGAAYFGPDSETFRALARREQIELERREHLYRAGRPPLEMRGRSVVIVDDGVATGATMLAALRAARAAGAAAVIAAAPVAASESVVALQAEADRVAILHIPPALNCIGEWYEDFSQLTDAEVTALLEQAAPPES